MGLGWQSPKNKKGDIVYCYVGKPYSKILYKMEVTKLDVKPSEKIENIKFYKNPEKVFHKSFVRLRKLEVYPDDDSNPYGLADLQLHGLGLKTKILSKRRVNEELLNYIFHPTLPFSLDEKQRSNKKETTESNVISKKTKHIMLK